MMPKARIVASAREASSNDSGQPLDRARRPNADRERDLAGRGAEEEPSEVVIDHRAETLARREGP